MDLKRREELKDALIEKFKAMPYSSRCTKSRAKSGDADACTCFCPAVVCVALLANTCPHAPDSLRAWLRPEGR